MSVVIEARVSVYMCTSSDTDGVMCAPMTQDQGKASCSIYNFAVKNHVHQSSMIFISDYSLDVMNCS